MKKKRKGPKRRGALSSKRTRSSKAVTASEGDRLKWTRINQPIDIPIEIRKTLRKLHQAGHLAYIVGGSVRDHLLERKPKDHDIVTDAKVNQLLKIFPNANPIGREFGVVRVGEIEVSSFRKDLDYQDHRHPQKTLPAGPQEDALRRDFTINALFYDPKTKRILDLVDGLEDLSQEPKIRAIGEPQHRFQEDALRLLRAIRFSSELSFPIESKTASAIKKNAGLITKISGERIRDELNLMLLSPKPAEAVKMLSDFGVLKFILPEVEALTEVILSPIYRLEENLWAQVLKMLELLSKCSPQPRKELYWATLLFQVGKPVVWRKTEGKELLGYEKITQELTRKICKRLRLTRLEMERIELLEEEHLKFKNVFQMREATLNRWLSQPFFEDLLLFHKIIALSTDGDLTYHEFCESRFHQAKESTHGAQLVQGDDLIQLGFEPGPLFSKIIRTIEDLAIERKLKSKEEALEFVVKHFVK